MAVTVAGYPISFTKEIDRYPLQIASPKGKELAIRNTGCNTLWVSFDRRTWFDVASGTSFDSRQEFEAVYVRTKIGRTSMVVLVTS